MASILQQIGNRQYLWLRPAAQSPHDNPAGSQSYASFYFPQVLEKDAHILEIEIHLKG